MAATAARGQLADGSTSEFVHNALVYLCAKFGAFIKSAQFGQILGLSSPTTGYDVFNSVIR